MSVKVVLYKQLTCTDAVVSGGHHQSTSSRREATESGCRCHGTDRLLETGTSVALCRQQGSGLAPYAQSSARLSPRRHRCVQLGRLATSIIIIIIIIIIIPRTIFIVLSIRRQPYARVHFGSSGQQSVSARWPPMLSCKLDLSVRLLAAIGRTFAYHHWYYYSTMRLMLIYRPSEGGRLSRPRHCTDCSQCAARGQQEIT